jgi:hypothetical protein
MSDRHLRILSRVARITQRKLDAHDAVRDDPGTVSTAVRDGLTENASRTRAAVAAAHARRRHVPDPQDRAPGGST